MLPEWVAGSPFREPQGSRLWRMTTSQRLGDASSDINDRVSSTSSGMRSWKVSKLLQFLGVRSRKFYHFEGEDITKAKALNHHVMELAGLRSFDNLNKMDVIWSSLEAEEMEAALHSVVEATSWMDWWT